MEEGELTRHVRKMRRVYLARRDHLVWLLKDRFGTLLSFHLPTGGMASWVRVKAHVDVGRWHERCREHQVSFYTGRHFAFDGRALPFVRLGFAPLREAELQRAVDRMVAALPTTKVSVRGLQRRGVSPRLAP